MGLPQSLPDWLAYLETLHPKLVAMGLDRVRPVYERLLDPPGLPVITVTGTNGKGSTCAMLEAILRRAGYRVGIYTSPHLQRYNERVRVNGVEATDAELCEAFAAVEAQRYGVALTYFEFGTLAALWLFASQNLHVWILEVGLGGRLDAVNIVDADVAVLTSVGIDHVDYLGPTREHIGREKAGIFRPGRIAICADPRPPLTVVQHAHFVGASLRQIGRDFGFVNEGAQWQFWVRTDRGIKRRFGLPFPALRGVNQLANAAAALAALDALAGTIHVDMGSIRSGLLLVELPGRFQLIPGQPAVVLDVAHNPQAAKVLADNLLAMGFFPSTFAVFSMLSDKDIGGVVAALAPRVDRWLIAPLPGPRGSDTRRLAGALSQNGIGDEAISEFPTVADAFEYARSVADEADRIVVFGSFLTVAAALSVAQLH